MDRCGVPPVALLQVSLHLLPRSRPRFIGILRKLPMSAPLTQQVPALVERLFKIMKPLRGIGDLARVFLHLVAQLMFSIDHFTNARENVGVVHAPQPRDATRSACLRVGACQLRRARAYRMGPKIAPINAPRPGSEPRKRQENVAG